MQLTERSWPRRLAMLVAGGGLVGAVLGLVVSSVTVAGYDASAFLLVTPSGDVPIQTSEVQYAQAISQIVTNPSVLGSGEDSADLPDAGRVRADASPNAPLIELVVNADDADTARREAQAAAEAVATYTQDRVDVLGFRAVVLAPATTGVPSGLSLAAYIAAGAVMGAVLGGLLGMLAGQRRTEVLDPWPRPTATAEPVTDNGTGTAGTGSATGAEVVEPDGTTATADATSSASASASASEASAVGS